MILLNVLCSSAGASPAGLAGVPPAHPDAPGRCSNPQPGTAALRALLVPLAIALFAASAHAVSWSEQIIASRAGDETVSASVRGAQTGEKWQQIETAFPIECDWALQDFGSNASHWLVLSNSEAVTKALIQHTPNTVVASPDLNTALNLYVRGHESRRADRLAALRLRAPRFVFTKHRTVRPSFFAYTEGQSDAQAERHFLPGSELCLLELAGTSPSVRTLLADVTGAIRDPAVSWDGARVLFAWKKALNTDDYHLYELTVASGAIRQITSGVGVADYEPAYLPNGDIVFASTRCVQITDCFWTEVSNLYTCDGNGRYLRRLGFDQVHTVYPQVLDDGRVIYTRWDYNDRGQVYPQALFQMNADGTGQSEFYGNNSWFPTTIAHARGIPGTQRVLAIFCGHHTAQAGKLGVLDPAKGRQENSGAQLVAPIRETPAVRIDQFGQQGELFQYPFPITETEFVVGYAPGGWETEGVFRRDARFGLFWMNMDGERELLVTDPRLPCSQPVALVPRTRPAVRPSVVDYAKTTGTVYMQDIYAGMGLKEVPRGTIKRLRVVALDFRPAGIGQNHSGGPGGGALSSTPVSIGNGAWDVKTVLGDVDVREDGSAYFVVPARTPVYFQALDAQSRAVQTMRSWTTLQPGEMQSCIGCHDEKNAAPQRSPGYATTVALKSGPQKLAGFYGPPRGFSFRTEIQPILDRHCTRCHDDRAASAALLDLPSDKRPVPAGQGTNEHSFSLLAAGNIDTVAKREWSDAYLILTQSRKESRKNGEDPWRGLPTGQMVNWIGSQSVPSALPAYFSGSTQSRLLPLIESGHRGVKLSREELDKMACWIDLLVPYCGDYVEANTWTAAEMEKYQRYAAKRQMFEGVDRTNIDDFLKTGARKAPTFEANAGTTAR